MSRLKLSAHLLHRLPRRLTRLGLTLCILALSLGFYPQRPSDNPPFYGGVSVLQADLQIEPLNKLIGGKKTLLFYFLPTCPHCQHAAPALARLQKKYAAELQFIGVSSARGRLTDVTAFKENFGLNLPMVQDFSSEFAQRNRMRATPVFVLTDGSATSPWTLTSFSEDMEPLLGVAIERFLGRDGTKLLDPTRYYGSAVCADCHREEYLSWGVNHHSVAMASLISIGKQTEARCVGCHVVAYGQPGGYQSLEATPHLADVGCEACHGAAGGHNASISSEDKAAAKKQSVEQRYEKQCVACHDAQHTIGFDLKKGIPLVGHHLDRTLVEAEWMARRTGLVKGEAARPLLAFPSGKIQGQAACASCHGGIHAQWSQDPHGRAMETLKKAGKDQDLSCVKCHATLTEPAREAELAAYSPGVGCESCHGPGEAHVKAGGGKGNIVALTGSCPVCVIESICGSCHTSERDKDFDLEKALETVRKGHKVPAAK